MKIIATGINHKTAAIDVREKYFLNSIEQDLLIAELKCNPSILEAFVLSTCNRTEVYASVLDSRENYFAYFIKLLSQIKKIPFHSAKISNYFYTYVDHEAIRHLFRVSAGLDSLVLGERQILGQVKAAIERAQMKGMFAKSFNIMANAAIRVGKKAQSETNIGYGGLSVSWAAMMRAEEILGTLSKKKILLIGAGKMGELAIHQLRNKGIGQLFLMNRTHSIAQEFAKKYQGNPVAFCDIKEILSEVDVCVCSTGAPHYILDKAIIDKVLRLSKQSPLVLIDISMPRNIDPAVSNHPAVNLTHIDQLNQAVSETMRIRQRSVSDVERIIEGKLEDYFRKVEGVDSSPHIFRLSRSHQ